MSGLIVLAAMLALFSLGCWIERFTSYGRDHNTERGDR